MRKVNVCVPVLNRYDLLVELLESLKRSTIKVDCVYVVDNGHQWQKVEKAFEAWDGLWKVHEQTPPMSVAASWNWFLDNVDEERFIVNDDVTFAPDSIRKMLEQSASFVSCGFGFSCFLIRHACVRLIGRFDEMISPGYAYFEDRDYLRRMRQRGLKDDVVQCGVSHGQSKTLEAYSPEQLQAHHRKFIIAQENFLKKWGSLDEDTPRQFMEGVNA